jgi:RNase P/RNase MRP subunit POP5
MVKLEVTRQLFLTLTKKKFRYVAIFIPDSSLAQRSLIVNRISARFIELFGTIHYSSSRSRILKSGQLHSNILVLKCSLETVSEMILSLYSIKEDLIIISISGSLKQLKIRSNDFVDQIAKSLGSTDSDHVKST